METIIHAGRKRIPITSIPVKTNPITRESRLFKSMHQHVFRSAAAIVRRYTMHQPLRVFVIPAILLGIIGAGLYFRYLLFLVFNSAPVSDHIHSLILGTLLIILAGLLVVLGIIADLIKINRTFLEDALERLKRLEHDDK
jgi:hypothetical protein